MPVDNKHRHSPSVGYRTNLEQGFSLLEVVIAVAIIALISAIAVPAFNGSLKNWEANEVRSLVTNAFRTAKTQSLIQRQNTIMCFANSNFQCRREATQYLLVFFDVNNDNRFTDSIDQIVLKQALGLDYGRVYLRAGNRHYIKFYGDNGLPRGHFGHIKYCSEDGNTANMYQISFNQQGNHRFKPYDFKPTGCPN